VNPFPFVASELSAGYRGKPLIKSLSFSLTEPGLVAIIGHNGSGKSTFFKTLFGEIPFEGSFSCAGKSLNACQPKSALLSLLPQQTRLSFPVSVLETVVMGRYRFRPFLAPYRQQDYQLARQALASLQMEHFSNQFMHTLSGGEQQLVWLAQFMLQDTPVCCLDEPTQALDVYQRKKIFDLMENWAYHQGKLVFCITHDLANLVGRKGWLLNLSHYPQALQPLNQASLSHHMAFLESGIGLR
jgi:iron complex transport system ATP-binding protein